MKCRDYLTRKGGVKICRVVATTSDLVSGKEDPAPRPGQAAGGVEATLRLSAAFFHGFPDVGGHFREQDTVRDGHQDSGARARFRTKQLFSSSSPTIYSSS